MKDHRKIILRTDYSFLTAKWLGLVEKNKLYKLIETTILTAKNTNFSKKFAVTLIFADNELIKEVNKNYRNKDKETNVLSLAANDFSEKDTKNFAMIGKFLMLGDIILSFEVIKSEAIEQNKLFTDHLSHLIVHSILHLLGYDHENNEEAEKMENLEIDILAKFGISSPYIV